MMEMPCLLHRKRVEDSRGFFIEAYKESQEQGTTHSVDYVQDNVSLSYARGTVRGLHYQIEPHAQAKYIQVLQGTIFDVAVDLRPESPNYLRSFCYTLTQQLPSCLYIPKGFAHGFMTLIENTLVFYKVDATYHAASERTLLWNDPQLHIPWPNIPPTLSPKDQNGQPLENLQPTWTTAWL